MAEPKSGALAAYATLEGASLDNETHWGAYWACGRSCQKVVMAGEVPKPTCEYPSWGTKTGISLSIGVWNGGVGLH